MHVLVTCNLSAPNPSDVVKVIAQIEGINLSVISDSRNYPDILGLDNERIHTYTPRRAWSLNMIDPVEIRRCRSLINKIGPDLMISFGASKLLFTSVVAGFNPSVFIPQGGETARAVGDYYEHEGALQKLRNRTTYRWAFKRLLNHVDEIWTGKPTIPVFERLGTDQEKIREIDFCSAVDTETYYSREDSIEYGSGNPVIGTFRRPRGRQILKNYRVFVDALARLRNKEVNFYSVIGGLYDDSIHQSVLRDMIHDRDLETNVELLSRVEKQEMPRYLSGLDIYVNIPYYDYDMVAIGTTSKEAMACECAYLTLDTANLSREWYINDSGILVNENDPISLADELRRMCENDSLRKCYAKKGRNLIKSKYSNEYIKSAFLRLCKQLEKYN